MWKENKTSLLLFKVKQVHTTKVDIISGGQKVNTHIEHYRMYIYNDLYIISILSQ